METSIPQSTYRGRDEIEGTYLPLSAGAYTSTLYVMVTRVKGGRHVPLHQLDFSIMIECMPEIGNYHFVCTLCSIQHIQKTDAINISNRKSEDTGCSVLVYLKLF